MFETTNSAAQGSNSTLGMRVVFPREVSWSVFEQRSFPHLHVGAVLRISADVDSRPLPDVDAGDDAGEQEHQSQQANQNPAESTHLKRRKRRRRTKDAVRLCFLLTCARQQSGGFPSLGVIQMILVHGELALVRHVHGLGADVDQDEQTLVGTHQTHDDVPTVIHSLLAEQQASGVPPEDRHKHDEDTSSRTFARQGQECFNNIMERNVPQKSVGENLS